MFKIRIFIVFVGSLLAGLGLTISLIAAVSMSDAQPTLSPFDQTDYVVGPDKGFAPLIVPTLRVNVIEPAASQSATVRAPADSVLSLTGTPTPIWFPDRLVIPAIQLDAPVVLATLKDVEYQGKPYQQWVAPDFFAAGRLMSSAPLGGSGNTVLIGHHNVYGEVFGHLVDLRVGDLIQVYSGDKEFVYAIALKMILPERFQPLAVRLANAQWIEASPDERLTLITCWPYESNTHRLIIVATRVSADEIANDVVTPRLTPQPPLSWKSTPTASL